MCCQKTLWMNLKKLLKICGSMKKTLLTKKQSQFVFFQPPRIGFSRHLLVLLLLRFELQLPYVPGPIPRVEGARIRNHGPRVWSNDWPHHHVAPHWSTTVKIETGWSRKPNSNASSSYPPICLFLNKHISAKWVLNLDKLQTWYRYPLGQLEWWKIPPQPMGTRENCRIWKQNTKYKDDQRCTKLHFKIF